MPGTQCALKRNAEWIKTKLTDRYRDKNDIGFISISSKQSVESQVTSSNK